MAAIAIFPWAHRAPRAFELARALQRRIVVRSQSPTGARPDAGFSLVEVMIATALLATSLAALAQLFAISVKNNAVAKSGTFAAALAAQKVEQLRGDAHLAASPLNTLRVSTGGYVDYLDSNGVRVGDGGVAVPDGTAYIRRWSVETVPDSSAFVLQVLVTTRRGAGSAVDGSAARGPGDARVATVMRYAP